MLTKILNQIKNELINLIALAKNNDEKIITKKLVQQSCILNDHIESSKISKEDKSML